MYAVPRHRRADRVRVAIRAFLARLRVVTRQLLHGLPLRQRGHTAQRYPGTPRAASLYTMLVASDVQRDLRGILP
jgi:hypothetical protein